MMGFLLNESMSKDWWSVTFSCHECLRPGLSPLQMPLLDAGPLGRAATPRTGLRPGKYQRGTTRNV